MPNHLWPFSSQLDPLARAHNIASAKRVGFTALGLGALIAVCQTIPSLMGPNFQWPLFLVNGYVMVTLTLVLLALGMARDIVIINRGVSLLAAEHIMPHEYEECLGRNLHVNRFYRIAAWLAPLNVWLAFRYLNIPSTDKSLEAYLAQLLGTTVPFILAGTPLIFWFLPKSAYGVVTPKARQNREDTSEGLYHNAYESSFVWAESWVSTCEAVKVVLATLRVRSIDEGRPPEYLRFAPSRKPLLFTKTPRLDIDELVRKAMISRKQEDRERTQRIARACKGMKISDYVPKDDFPIR